MNIKEALEWSKANAGKAVSRASPLNGHVGWIAWDSDGWVYKLQFEDLTADDWEPSAETIDRVRGGRWKLDEDKAT